MEICMNFKVMSISKSITFWNGYLFKGNAKFPIEINSHKSIAWIFIQWTNPGVSHSWI